MICPFCNQDQLVVTNSRPTAGEMETWRRRKCLHCGNVFTTHEKIDLSFIVVVKRNGRRVKYNRAKLYSSVYHCLSGTKHMDRGTAGDLSEKLMHQIEKEIIGQKTKEITSVGLFQLTANVLKKEYPDSYLRYLAYFSKNLELEINKLNS